MALEGEGLRLVDDQSGSARPIRFGSTKADVMQRLQAVLGSAPIEEGENIDCGATLATWANGLTTWFSRDRFAGWSVRSGADTLATVGGIGLGSTRRELLDVYAARITESSLGIEFSASGLAGLLESSSTDARITNLWAGVACVAR